jgi:hypothetical protein
MRAPGITIAIAAMLLPASPQRAMAVQRLVDVREIPDFFFAHEYGHIRYGHAGAALADPHGELSALRQRQELEADCYAVGQLATTNPAAVDAALQFFTRLGPLGFDALHPSGSQRAAKILACMPC